MELRLGDIYHFHYNEEESKRLGISTSHCFEGTLHVRELGGELKLVDTYWGISGDGRQFTLAEAAQKGQLTFYCNLNDVERISSGDQVYFADADLFTVSEQHGCVPRCVTWFKRKDATRNAEKMMRIICERAASHRRDVESAIDSLERLAVMKQQLSDGNLKIYLPER